MSSSTDLRQENSNSVGAAKPIRWLNDNGIAVITIDVPDTKVNTLSRYSMTELNAVLDEIVAQAGLKGLVIASGKTDNFIAGADVNEIQVIQHQSQLEAYDAAQLGKEVFAKIEKLPFATVAAINGTCLGGGTELTLWCKYRVATSKAKIGLPEVKLGLIPGWGGCIRLPKLIGLQQSLGLVMEGKIVDAKKAWRLGLIDEVVEGENLIARAKEIAGGQKPKRGASKKIQESLMGLLLETNPIGLNVLHKQAHKMVMRATKGKYPAPVEALKVMIKGVRMPAEKGYELESRTFSRLAMTSVSKNLVGIFFAQTESKRMPSGAGKPSVNTVGVLGAGVMGAGIAQACAKAGYKVVVKDIEQKFLDKGKATITDLFDNLVQRKKMTTDEAKKMVDEIVFTTNYSALADCDLVIEAVLEDLALKQKALAELDQTITKPYVFATNTSSLSVSKIAEGTADPGKVVGLHFFNPVHKMPLVEIVKGAKTSNEAISAAMSVALKLDKTTVITNDAPGFVVNRILAPYLREAAVLAEEGVPIPDIDKAMKDFGMPMGPMVLLDEIGLDIAAKVIHVMHDALGERMAPPSLMNGIADLKLLGRKGGKGIYLYDEKTKKPSEVNPDVQALIKSAPSKKSKGEIQDRLVLLMLNEAVRCLEEKVVEDPAQLDLAMIFGTGFAPFTGGILKYADAEGIAIVYEKLDYLSRVVGERYKPAKLLQEMAERKQPFYKSRAAA